MSKGSNRRPQKVDDKKVQENWERIFGKKESPVSGNTPPQAEGIYKPNQTPQ